jgi:hypothetical protein
VCDGRSPDPACHGRVPMDVGLPSGDCSSSRSSWRALGDPVARSTAPGQLDATTRAQGRMQGIPSMCLLLTSARGRGSFTCQMRKGITQQNRANSFLWPPSGIPMAIVWRRPTDLGPRPANPCGTAHGAAAGKRADLAFCGSLQLEEME